MTHKETFPLRAVEEHVSARGGITAILEARNITGYDHILAASRYAHALSDAVPEVPFTPALSLKVADGLAIEVLGVHPSLVWHDWFDDTSDAPNYGVIEDELLLGRFDTRKEFWDYVQDYTSTVLAVGHERQAFIANLMPEARAYLASLPVLDENHLPPAGGRPRLAVGGECVNGHKIKAESDLTRNGYGSPGCKQCRKASSKAQRDKKRADRLAKGEATRKLSPKAIADIKDRLGAGEKQAVLALEYGVSQPMISKIKRGISHNESEAA